MEIKYNYKGYQFTAHYDEDGYLTFVEDTAIKEKLMIEIYQEGTGIEMSDTNGYIVQSTCKAMYVRVMVADLFIPKFLFIENKKKKV